MVITCLSFSPWSLNSEQRLQQSGKPALEPQRSVGYREADTVFAWAGEGLMFGTFVRFSDVAAIQNGIAITQASRKDKG